MARYDYNVREGSLQERFDALRGKVQVFGGGFGNGKTAAACVLKALVCARDYPGANILIARATYPKLNDTIRKEFFKWCPAKWIARKPTKDDNTCILSNGTHINFRYIAQQGKNTGEGSTSNLLSATYDLIIVDQMEDPEIVHKDFIDLMGRLRGSARYQGNDPSMPLTGPRWFVATVNPTRNWIYKQLIRPLHVWNESQHRMKELLWDHERNRPMIELVEGSTYENKDNLPEDFISGLESTYQGSMRERFLLGKWAGYEGLVYPMYNTAVHSVNYDEALHYFKLMPGLYNKIPSVVEGYDYGMSSPACYLFGLNDLEGNVVFLDGFYKAGLLISEQIYLIKAIRAKYCDPRIRAGAIFADPSIFRKTPKSKDVIGETVANMFWDNGKGVEMIRGNNNITNGITKVQNYLAVRPGHINPFNQSRAAPHLYFAETLDFLDTEIADYYWDKDSSGEPVDKPRDRNDHAMDTLKYALSDEPELPDVYKKPPIDERLPRGWMEPPDSRSHMPTMREARYG